MSGFNSLFAALEEWFDKSLSGMSGEVLQSIKQDFSPMLWDDLSPDQRRSVAVQLDYQHDFATEHDRKFWWDFFIRMDGIETAIAT